MILNNSILEHLFLLVATTIFLAFILLNILYISIKSDFSNNFIVFYKGFV